MDNYFSPQIPKCSIPWAVTERRDAQASADSNDRWPAVSLYPEKLVCVCHTQSDHTVIYACKIARWACKDEFGLNVLPIKV